MMAVGVVEVGETVRLFERNELMCEDEVKTGRGKGLEDRENFTEGSRGTYTMGGDQLTRSGTATLLLDPLTLNQVPVITNLGSHSPRSICVQYSYLPHNSAHVITFL